MNHKFKFLILPAVLLLLTGCGDNETDVQTRSVQASYSYQYSEPVSEPAESATGVTDTSSASLPSGETIVSLIAGTTAESTTQEEKLTPQKQNSYTSDGKPVKIWSVDNGIYTGEAENYAYDASGRLAVYSRSMLSADGTENIQEVRRYTYTSTGKEQSVRYEMADGTLYQQIQFSYDEAGNAVAEQIVMYTADGEERTGTLIQRTFDGQGNVLTEDTYDGDSLQKSLSYTYEFYADGSVSKKTETRTVNGEITAVSVYVYDQKGNLTRETVTGSVAAYSDEYVYDAKSRELSVRSYGETGVISSYLLHEYTDYTDGSYMDRVTSYTSVGEPYDTQINYYDMYGTQILPIKQ